MKKIKPIERYDADHQYPTMAEVEAEAEVMAMAGVMAEVEGEPKSGRRFFLKGLVAGVAVVGAGLLPGREARARSGAGAGPGPGPKIPPPGVPPRPDPRKRPPPRDTPALPGGAPAPQPNLRPTPRPCTTGGPVAVTLNVVFTFCDGKTGQVTVTTNDRQVAAKLRQPGEGRRLASVIKPVFALESSCAWLQLSDKRIQVEARLARALTDFYQQALGGEIQPLKVSLAVRSEPRVTPTLGGVPPRPDLPPPPGLPPRPTRGKGCASCSTAASVQDVLVPAGLVGLALVALKNRGK